MPRTQVFEHVPDVTAERIAYVIGEFSAYARALDEVRARRAAGEDAHLFRSGSTILVGPWPESDEHAGTAAAR